MSLASTFSTLEPPFSAHLGEPEGDGWIGAEQGCVDDALLEELLAGVADLYGTDRRDIMATRVVEIWAWSVASPAAAALLVARRLPDLCASNVLVQPPAGVALRRATFYALPGDPACDHADARVVADERALLAELRRALAEEHLEPLVLKLNAMTQRPVRALWRSAADRVVGAFEWAGEQLGAKDEALALAAGCLRDAPEPLTNRVRVREVDGVRAHVRDGCCLYWRVDGAQGEPCVNCPLTERDLVSAPARG